MQRITKGRLGWIAAFASVAFLLSSLPFVFFPGLKYWVYKHLPPDIRWDISFAVTDKFVVGMVYFVENDGKVLLVRHSYQDKWGLPGGWLEKNESFEQSARRELREELGIEIDSVKVLEMNKVPKSQIIEIAIFGKMRSETIAIRDGEISEFKFFDRGALPKDILYTHKPYINRYLLEQGDGKKLVVH